MNRNWEHCEEKPEKSGIDVIRKGERMLESVARWTIPHNSKCRYGERGAADAKPKAQIILDVLSNILATQMPCRSGA